MSGLTQKNTNADEFVVIRKPAITEYGGLTWVEGMDIYSGQVINKKEFKPAWNNTFLMYDGFYFLPIWLESCSDQSSAKMALDFKEIDEKYDAMIYKLKNDFEQRKKHYEARKPKKSFWDRILGR